MRRKPGERKPRCPPRGSGGPAGPPDFSRMFQAFDEVVAKDLIPYIDSNLSHPCRIGTTARSRGFPWAACSPISSA